MVAYVSRGGYLKPVGSAGYKIVNPVIWAAAAASPSTSKDSEDQGAMRMGLGMAMLVLFIGGK